MRVLLDVDGVLGDFPNEVLAFCNRYGRGNAVRPWELSDVKQHDILKALGLEHMQQRLDQHMRDSDFCRHMPVYDGAQAFVEELKSFAEVVIVTSSYSDVAGWEYARRAWLKEHFGIEKQDVVFAKRKELVGGDMLLDDKLRNIEAWTGAWPWGAAVVFDRPWNQGGDHERATDHGTALRYARFVDSVLKKSETIRLAVKAQ